MLLRQIISLCTEPPVRPVRRLTLYYVVLFGAVATVMWLWPSVGNLFEDGGFAISGNLFEPVGVAEDWSEAAQGRRMVALMLSMTGTLLLMLPVSWGYMGTRRRTGFDQSVVQTMVILPIAVAGIVVMVKSSVALAFSLAGIVAGVRFRNTLKDTADALYIFTAIGVGLAAGIGELGFAVVISVFFNYVILGLWSCDYGTCPLSGPKYGWSASAVPDSTSGKHKHKHKKHKHKDKERQTPDHDDPAASGGETVLS